MPQDNETENLEAFELVTEALANIDAYQETRNGELLISAHESLSRALELDEDYFRARYFLAMVNYLQGKPDESQSVETNAVAQFQRLTKFTKDDAVALELNYNRAAALFQAESYFEAIKLFETTISESQKDPEVNLLARAGLALSLATRLVKDQSENPDHDKARVESEHAYISRMLSTGFVEEFFRVSTPIDPQVARRVGNIIGVAHQLVKDRPVQDRLVKDAS